MEQSISGSKTLLTVISKFVSDLKKRVGNDYSISTYEKYVFTEKKAESFLKYIGKQDILLTDLTVGFIVDFDHYLRTVDNNKHNTAVKYCINLKRIINDCVLRGYLLRNPFQSYKTRYKFVFPVFLSEKEVEVLQKLKLERNTHLLVRDLFLFQCHTGLSYTDLSSLSDHDIVERDGRFWIIKPRQKTGIVAVIPLLPQAIALIEKHKTNNQGSNRIFSSYTIQKYNHYLGEISMKAGITKPLSSHVGRRTFGNLAISKGISINVISKILGHSSTIITEKIYAVTSSSIIANEMDKWKQ
jgi:integrase